MKLSGILALIAILAAGYVARGVFRNYVATYATGKTPGCLELLGNTTTEDEGRTYIIGSVTNNCGHNFSHVTVLFKLDRAPGAFELSQGIAHAYGRDIKAGEIREFKSALPIARDAKYRLTESTLTDQRSRSVRTLQKRYNFVEGDAMTEDQKNQGKNDVPSSDIARRDFVALSVTAGLAAGTAGPAAAAGLEVVETNVEVKTPDGICDAAFIHPKTGSHPGVLIWPDAFGLRPSMRDMAKRLAAEGYSVLVPNPFYRISKAPFSDASNFNFQNQADMAKLQPLMASVNAPGNAEKDAAAYVAFLDAQKEVNKSKKIGTQGYCMGGPLVVKTAAALPDRIGAGGSFHGGGLVTDQPSSPHLLAPKIKARMYFGIASNDDMRQPDAKDKLKAAFAAAKVPAEIELYPAALHGWCVPDMPAQNGAPIYNKADAERAWAKLLALYKAGIA